MKQMTIFCSRDLEERVVSCLDRNGVDGFLRVGEATGNRFLPQGQVPRSVTWEATVFIVPASPDERVATVCKELRDYAGTCEIEPCLRVTVVAVDETV